MAKQTEQVMFMKNMRCAAEDSRSSSCSPCSATSSASRSPGRRSNSNPESHVSESPRLRNQRTLRRPA